VAVKGFKQDGHAFLGQAKENGAVAAMGEGDGGHPIETYVHVANVRKAMSYVAARFYGYPGLKIKACGVTGTNGKTTTCYMIREILRARNKATGLVTSQVYDTGANQFPAERSTPESLDLQRLLLLMNRGRCVNVVIEVSSHALALHRVDNINFQVVVFTNITRDHLDFHKTMDEYLKVKASLLKLVKDPLSYAVINLDVPEFKTFFGEIASAFISYSMDKENADVRCGNFQYDSDETTFDLVTPMGTRTVHLKLPGRFNLMNALAAAAAGLASGVDIDNVVTGLERVRPVPGRLNPISAGQPFAVYVDYAHTPDALRRLCETARELCEGRVLLLFGCGGDRDRGKRPIMGETATKNADYVVVTSDNPRSEDAGLIIDDIKPGLQGRNYEIQVDRKEAISAIMREARSRDVVLVGGKGAEPYQEIKGERHPFDDTAETLAVLASLGYGEQKANGGN